MKKQWGELFLDSYTIFLYDSQKVVGPYLSQALCAKNIGMEEEIARVAGLLGEQYVVVLEEVPNISVAGMDLGIFLCDGVDDGVVAVKPFEALLQVHGAVVCVGTIPDGIVEEDPAIRHTSDE